MGQNVLRRRGLDPAQPGAYVLSVYLPMPFGMGRQTHLVDRVEYRSIVGRFVLLEGMDHEGNVVVSFPCEQYQYMLVDRRQYDIISQEQVEAEERDAQKRLNGESREDSSSSVDVVEMGYL